MRKFKGVILAGGRGSRLSPFTEIINKFLLPVYDKVLIEHSIYSLKDAGIKDIAIVLGVKSAGETIDYLKDGSRYDVDITYLYQSEPLGVAHALYQAKNFAGESNIVVLCADNIIHSDLNPFVKSFESGVFISCKKFDNVEQLKRFAVLEFNEDGSVARLVEKPKNPPSSVAFCGVQIYGNDVWSIIEGLKPSQRGEYEIVDVINNYISRGEFNYGFLDKPWFDCGTPQSLLEAQVYSYLKAGGNIERVLCL